MGDSASRSRTDRRTLVVLTVVAAMTLALSVILAGGASGKAQKTAQDLGPCTLTGPTQEASTIVTGGTKIGLELECDSGAREFDPVSLDLTVTVTDLFGEEHVVFAAFDELTMGSRGSDGALVKEVHIPTPPGGQVCVGVNGDQVCAP